jgi:hypothetical protein
MKMTSSLLRTYKRCPSVRLSNGSDFHDFYTIKPFWVGDSGAKALNNYFNF